MKTLKVTLKQHTPQIHFQHNQHGATLRASEVKPKLDRFILSKLGNGDYKVGCQKAKAKKWLVGKGDHPALNYKMKIVCSGIRKEFLVASYISPKNMPRLNGINVLSPTPYFAQEKENGEIVKGYRKWSDIKCKGITHECIKVEIFSLTDSIIDYIGQFIQSFFVSVNFGTRQSKGFGSFTISELVLSVNEREIKLNLQNEEKLLKDNYATCYKKELRDASFNTIFSTITEDYRWLKSGKSKPYAKSKLMLYGLKSNKRWDKKFFKENVNEKYKNRNGYPYKLLDKRKNTSNSINDNEKYYYLRALLGLAGQYEFLLENPPVPNKKLIISVEGGEVERFKSPIFFKVIGGTLYLVANPISQKMLDKQFRFYVNVQGDNRLKNELIEKILCTPGQFDIIEFLDFAMRDNNNGRLNYKKI